jgi:hypothetical protein
MSNYLNPSSAFITLIVAFGLFTGGTIFMGSTFDKHNVQQEQDLTVDKQYDKIQNNTRQLDQRLETVTSDQGSVVDTASAGILIVPDTLSLLVQPIGIATQTLGSISSAFPALIPSWLQTMLQLTIIAAIGFGIFRVLLGVTDI